MRNFAFLALVVFAACGDDPVNYSDDIGIEVKTKSGDATDNAITEEKGITTESSNPYGAFITEAKNVLDRFSKDGPLPPAPAGSVKYRGRADYECASLAN